MTAPIVRFAPSPTGRIHIGNARTALYNWLFARKRGGRFILRFDDTDVVRSTREYADSIEEDLRWLGVDPDIMVRQSERFALYDAAMQTLRAAGRLYACYESQEELDRKRKRQLARGLPPVYDRAALALSAEERARLEAEGRKPHWRFMLERETVEWDDLSRGPSRIDCASLSDPVMVREDGAYLYTLPSVVDDIELGVTHVIRGEDHVTNTAVQLQLFRALAPGRAAPAFAHHNLLATASGEGLSKRTGSLSIASLRDAGRRGAGRRRAGRADRHVRQRASRRFAGRTRRRRRTSPTSPIMRRSSTRRIWSSCPRARCTSSRSRRSLRASPSSASRARRPNRSGRRCAAISKSWTMRRRGLRSVSAKSSR